MADIELSQSVGGEKDEPFLFSSASTASSLPKLTEELGEDEEPRRAAETLRLLQSLFFSSALGERCSGSLAGSSAVQHASDFSTHHEGGTRPTLPFFPLSTLMRETVSEYRTILEREKAGHPVDPDEQEAAEATLCAVRDSQRREEGEETDGESQTPGGRKPAELLAPFRPKYAGRRLLQKTAQDLYRAYRLQRGREAARRNDSAKPIVDAVESVEAPELSVMRILLCLAHLYGLLGQNYINTEETAEGERRLRKCVELIAKAAALYQPLFGSKSGLQSSVWSFLLFSPAALRVRVALALLDLSGLYARWQRGRDARTCLSRVAPLLALAESDLEEEWTGLICANSRGPTQGAEDAETEAQCSASEQTREAARLLGLVIHSLRFLRRCVSAQVWMLPIEGNETENGGSASPEEAAQETCTAMGELLEKRERLLKRAREREEAEQQSLARGESATPEEERATEEALQNTGGGKRGEPVEAVGSEARDNLFAFVSSRSDVSRIPVSASSLPSLVFTFFSFSPFVVDTKEIVRNLLSLATFYGFSSLSASSLAGSGRGLVTLFSAEYILQTAECLVEEEAKRLNELRLLREARRRREKATEAQPTSGVPESDACEVDSNGPPGDERAGPELAPGDQSESDEEEMDREGGEVTARICRPNARTLEELLAEVRRDKSLLYARRLRLSRDVLSDPAGLLDPLTKRQETEGRATETVSDDRPSTSEGEARGAAEATRADRQGKENKYFAELLEKQTTQFPPVLQDAQDCLALLSLPEAFLARKLLDKRATGSEGDAVEGAIEGSRAESDMRPVVPDERTREQEGIADFFSLSVERGAALLLGGHRTDASRAKGCSEALRASEETFWRPLRGEEDRLVRLTDDLYLRCAVRFAPFHHQVGQKMRKMNYEFLQCVAKLDSLPPALRPYATFISKHLMALALCDDFAAPRCLFVMANHEAQAALKTFALDGWTTEHTRLIIHEAALYKELSFFENDVQRYMAMHSRRAKLLAALVVELNPQHYLDLVRQMHFELGETYKEIYDVKWTGQINRDAALDDDVTEMNPDVVQREEVTRMRKSTKLHGYAERSVAHFSEFIESFQKKTSSRSQKTEENEVCEELLPLYLAARLTRAKMLMRLGRDRDEMIQGMVRSLKEYEWLRNFLSQRETESSDSFLLRQLSLCEQTLQLLPLRISKLAALGR
ncbi:KBP-like protein [Toxoplasma gondii VEG]|uniref:KIF-binding protein n=3 Tax=Toxoplasma gondii TaxID=5811 RepID=V4Z8D9_TOXGV|nr:KBP-like protein [Toxoplasma gondii VEG]KFG52589.1 KBP-like protein [Toxoplasma gondii p89]PUA87637.1 KBP-like protein [Toxoplasma gondii TgCATBr9]CEL75514.1 TPA: KIF1-binding protein homolog [Toxoplasma gondii VEG]